MGAPHGNQNAAGHHRSGKYSKGWYKKSGSKTKLSSAYNQKKYEERMGKYVRKMKLRQRVYSSPYWRSNPFYR